MANKYDIRQDYKIPTGVAGNYRNGYKKPEGVVIHASANPNAGVDSEISYMAKNYKNAFTHAWAGHDKIIEISNTHYACWGAGGVANKRFVQIEMTEDKRLTKKQKLQVVDRAAYWAAVQLVYYGLPCKDASKGSGTVWGHTHVSQYLGGTDHTDPIAFLKTLGLTWNDVYRQVERYYNAYKKGNSDTVKGLDGTQGADAPSKPSTSKPANKTIEQLADEVIAGKHGTGEARKKALGSNYQAVQNLVNKKLGAKPVSKPSKSIEQLAQEVIAGKHGSGEARKKALGSKYQAVQNRVNQILGGGATKPSSKPKGVKVGDTVTTKALYANSGSTKNVRSSSIKGYVDTINNNWRNPIRLRNKKDGYYLGFTRKQDLV